MAAASLISVPMQEWEAFETNFKRLRAVASTALFIVGVVGFGYKLYVLSDQA